jgi:aconitate hydratase
VATATFEGRIHPLVQANYLASPPLVVAYALAGTVDIDFQKDPIGEDEQGNPVYLRDVWPTSAEVAAAVESAITPEMFREEYDGIETSNEDWNAIKIPEGSIYEWDESSTYVQEPPFFTELTNDVPGDSSDRKRARTLACRRLDDHRPHFARRINSAGWPGRALSDRARRSSARLQLVRCASRKPRRHDAWHVREHPNQEPHLAWHVEGGMTKHFPTGEQLSIYEAAMRYIDEGTPLVVLGGKDYGMGSSRDWAAKGTILLGVKAVIVESFERIHRSNLIGMGVLPLQYAQGQNAESLGLDGTESFSIPVSEDVKAGQSIEVTARKSDGREVRFDALVRIDTPIEVEYYRNGGILHYVLRDFLRTSRVSA